MAQVLIRNIDDDTLEALKARARLSGKSLEQELREIVRAAAPLTAEEKVEASRRLRAAFPRDDFDIEQAIRIGRGEAEDLSRDKPRSK